MKKINYLLLGLAGLAMASCSNEVALEGPAKDGNVHLTVTLPSDYATRATMNDGTTATYLYVAIYDADNNNAYVFSADDNFAPNATSTEVNLNLTSGKNYTVALFATAENPKNSQTNAYTFNAQAGTLTVNYANMVAANLLDDTYDCFYANTSLYVDGDTSLGVKLYRPIAQINWGTNDLNAASVKNDNAFGENGKYLQSNLSTNAYNVLDVVTGQIPQNAQLVSVDFQAYPNLIGETWPGPTATPAYAYIAMQYLLAPINTTANYTLTLTVNNGATYIENEVDNTTSNTSGAEINYDVVVADAPVQANYQTNIYGSLLTDNVNLQVEKMPGWSGNFLEPQDKGTQVTDDEGNAVDGLYVYTNPTTSATTYTVSSVTGLEYYATKIATGMYSRNTIILDSDITFESNQTHTPFYLGDGTFDGQGHTITNMTVKATGSGQSNYAAFICVGNGNIQNVNFVNANVTGNDFAAVVVADGVAGNINNVTVTNSTVTSTPYESNGTYAGACCVGMIAGYVSGESTGQLTNCKVNGGSVTGYNVVGGILGRANAAGGTCVVENNTISNVNVTANQYISANATYTPGSEDSGLQLGEVVGNNYNDEATVQNNNATNVNVLYVNSSNQYEVSSIEQIQAVSNLGYQQLHGKTVSLVLPDEMNGVLDLGGATITPITFSEMSGGDWGLNFNGNNNTIKNFTVEAVGERAGLFSAFGGGTFENLNVDSMTINTSFKVSGAGVIAYSGGGVVQNVNVSNSTIINYPADASATDGGSNTGAVIGLTYGTKVNNCKVTNCTISDYKRAGAIIGFSSEGTSTISGCTVTECHITATSTGTAGILGGVNNSNITSTNNTITDCTVDGVAVENQTAGN